MIIIMITFAKYKTYFEPNNKSGTNMKLLLDRGRGHLLTTVTQVTQPSGY